MVVVERWIKDTTEYLFEYALRYITDTNIIPTPKFHMIDANEKMAIVSCDFWAETPEEERDYDEFGTVLDRLAESYGAVASLLVLAGEIGDVSIIGIVTHGERAPKFHYKELIWNGGIPDFSPTITIPWNKGSLKNFKF